MTLTAFATTYTFVGTGESPEWTTTSNWYPDYPGIELGEEDIIIILQGKTVSLPDGAMFINQGVITNYGTMLNSARIINIGVLHNNGVFKNATDGSLKNEEGGMIINAPLSLLESEGLFINDGDIGNLPGAMLSATSILGSLEGNAGGISPGVGASVGEMDILDDFSVGAPTSNIILEIADTGDYDRLNVGNASISGALEVRLINGFIPSVGDKYSILNYIANNGGEFEVADLPDIRPNKWEVEYTSVGIVLRVVADKRAEIISLDAWEEGSGVMLEWVTSEEINNKGFYVERLSQDGQWETLGFVESMGDSDNPTIYNFLDETPFWGRNEYRLLQVYLDESSNYSETVWVSRIKKDVEMGIYPNPVGNWLTISLAGMPAGENATLSIYSSVGQLLEQSQVVNGQEQFNVSLYAAGVYIVFLELEDGENHIQKFIKD